MPLDQFKRDHYFGPAWREFDCVLDKIDQYLGGPQIVDFAYMPKHGSLVYELHIHVVGLVFENTYSVCDQLD